MIMRSTVGFAAKVPRYLATVVALCAGAAVTAGCAQQVDGSATPAVTISAVVPAAPETETPQERSVRVRDELVRLGCDSSACIQTYFACEDGLLSGEACEFQRQHPIE